MSEKSASSPRLHVLDYLRGFFIVVIIIDHLSRWPSLLSIFTGKAWLWVTAAEGFVAISGLLVGYVRGYKNRTQPLKEVSKKLVSRGLLLYLWAIIGSVLYTAAIWYLPLQGGAPGIPIERGDWATLLWNTITLQYTQVWVYFLAPYALFLVASPIAIWLLRTNRALLLAAISGALLVLGWQIDSMALQWQALFFIPAIAGYYLDSIMGWWRRLTNTRRLVITTGVVAAAVGTITFSVITTFYAFLLPDIAGTLNGLFPKDTMTLQRILMAFLWFMGLIMLFHLGYKLLSKTVGWLLLPIGTNSLTAYISHGILLLIISLLGPSGENVLINTLLGIVAIVGTWAIVKIPGINRVIPR